MKKIVILLMFILFTGTAHAGSCPMMTGDHAKSEELLNKAMELFKS